MDAFSDAKDKFRSRIAQTCQSLKKEESFTYTNLLSTLLDPRPALQTTSYFDSAFEEWRNAILPNLICASAPGLATNMLGHFMASPSSLRNYRLKQQYLDEDITQLVQLQESYKERVLEIRSDLHLSSSLVPTPLICQSHLYKSDLLLEQLVSRNGPLLDQTDSIGRTILHCVFETGNPPVNWQRFDWQPFINKRDVFGRTALHIACQRGSTIENIVFLLSQNAEVDMEDDLTRTPLSWAAENGHEAVVKQLLEAGAEIDSKDDDAWTPLSWAAGNGREAVVKQLLEAGAEIDSEDNDARTPLSWAAENGHEAVVKQLLEAGAEIDSKDNDARTPLSWAAENGHEAVVKLLQYRTTTSLHPVPPPHPPPHYPASVI